MDEDKLSYQRELMKLAKTMSTRTAAPMFGVSHSTMARWKQQANPVIDGKVAVGKVTGQDGKVRPNRRVDNTGRDARILELRGQGKSVREVAAEVGCSVGTVHRIVNRGSSDTMPRDFRE